VRDNASCSFFYRTIREDGIGLSNANQIEFKYDSQVDSTAEAEPIAAVSTAVGDAAIAIVRISGAAAFTVADKIFRIGNEKPNRLTLPRSVTIQESHTVQHGFIVDDVPAEYPSSQGIAVTGVSEQPDKENQSPNKIDEVLLIKMEAPRTYTRENTVEIHCHGGSVIVSEVLRCVIAAGARPAEPGEFTKRAFLNGRMDLVEAEAVMDVIQSHTKSSAKAAFEQLNGRLSVQIKKMRENLIMLIGQMEVNLDYPEFDAEEVTLQSAEKVLFEVLQQMDALLAQYQHGRILREGFNLVIAGKPNAGKSTLMNRLAGQEKSIVTDIPGTTRDIVEAYISLKGLPVRLYDTAGIRETQDVIEKIGVDKTVGAMEQAEMIAAVFDGASMPTAEDGQLVQQLKKIGGPVLYIINKTDNGHPDIEEALTKLFPKKPVSVSALVGTGMEFLIDEIVESATGARYIKDQEVILTNARHKKLLDIAKVNIEEAIRACETGMTHDVLSFLVREAWENLGGIVGEGATEDLLNHIFSRFCLGK